MTNLSADAVSRRFSRERILMAAPLSLGLLAAVGVVVFQTLPTLARIAELDSRLQDVSAQRQQVPALRERLDAAQNKIEQAQLQQVELLDLIAGSDRIQTFLALLDQRARSTGVEIQRFEPIQEASSQNNGSSRSSGSSNQTSPEAVDPLQELGYRLTSVALNVAGSYNQLQSFLQEMEKLEVVVEASDLTLKAASDSAVDGEAASNNQSLELSLRFRFYDRSPADQPGTAGSPTSAEEAAV